ncbi:MAG: hypothetical protein M3O22_07350 [Pseudomonadota bacterium]|nr:hypothetical protein [Pseudomonadota bacterium]
MSLPSRRIASWLAGAAAVTALVTGLALYNSGTASPARAATEPAYSVLRLELKIDATETWENGKDKDEWRNATVREIHTSEIPMKTVGNLRNYNSMDPLYHQKLAAQKPAAGHSPMASTAAMPDMAKMQEMQKKVQVCSGDKNCLQKAAMDMAMQNMSKRGPQGAQVAADFQAMSADCTNIHGHAFGSKGYEKCMDDLARKRSTGPVTADAPEPEEPEDRFQYYRTRCTTTGHSRIDRSGTGKTQDIGGGREGHDYTRGESDLDPKAPGLICAGDTVVDVKAGKIYTLNINFPSIPVETEYHYPPIVMPKSQEKANIYNPPVVVKDPPANAQDKFDKDLRGQIFRIFWNGAPLSGEKIFTLEGVGGENKFGYGKNMVAGTATLTWSFRPYAGPAIPGPPSR